MYVLTGADVEGSAKAEELRRAGAHLLPVAPGRAGGLDPDGMLSALAEQEIDSILVEGGAELISAFAERDLVDLWHIWISPIVVGAGPGVLARAQDPPGRLGPMHTIAVDGDILVTALTPDGLSRDRTTHHVQRNRRDDGQDHKG